MVGSKEISLVGLLTSDVKIVEPFNREYEREISRGDIFKIQKNK